MDALPQSQAPVDRRLRRAIDYVARNLARCPTLGEVSTIAGLERTYFSSRFRKAIGITFQEWNRRIRIDRAKCLLVQSDLTITAIGLAVGYSDVTTFERNFRRCTNVSPRQYRQAVTQSRNTIFAEKPQTSAETDLPSLNTL
jgi:AraC-like DNA-binding protein